MQDGRISADEAYKRVSKVRPFGAGQAICARAHDGVLTAFAKVFIFDDDRREDYEIPKTFWWARGQAALEQNWASGDFETWIDKRHHCRAYGVTFDEHELSLMVPKRVDSLRVEQLAGQGYALARRARAELVKATSCTETQAEAEILRRCRAGFVKARCQSFSIRNSNDIDSDFEEQNDAEVPNWFWERCISSSDTVLDWAASNFAGSGFLDGEQRRVRLRGVEFMVADIVDMEADLRPPVAARQTPTGLSSVEEAPPKQGGRKMTQKWADWVAELAHYIHNTGIPEGAATDGMDALIAAIDQRLINRGLEVPGRTTVQPAVRAVLLRLRAPPETE